MNTILRRLVWPVLLAPAVYLAFVWNRIPETVALHFDIQGNPDRYGSKRELIVAVIILLAVNLFTYLLLTNIHRIDPKKYAVENRERLSRIAFATSVFLSGVVIVLILSTQYTDFKIGISLILSLLGLLFAIIGNYMPNMKPNYFAGFRVPWTLESPDNWRKTHQLGGRIWFAGGLVLAITSLFLPAKAALVVFFAVISLMIIIPFVYSYRNYKKMKQERAQ